MDMYELTHSLITPRVQIKRFMGKLFPLALFFVTNHFTSGLITTLSCGHFREILL